MKARLPIRSWQLLCVCILPACSFARHDQCAGPKDCQADQQCYHGFCVRPDAAQASSRAAATTGNAAGSSSSAGAGRTGSVSQPNTSAGTAARQSTAGATGRAGVAPMAGTQAAAGAPTGSGTAGAPGVLNTAGVRAMAPARAGTTGAPAAVGGSQAGTMSMTPVGPAGQAGNVATDPPAACIETSCYPEGQMGCTLQPDGQWMCQGACMAGRRACTQGQLGECVGYKTPAAEVCTSAGAIASDEDCNGITDDTCACLAGDTRSCYDGREGTMGIGRCVAGTQTCSDGAFGTCQNAVTPGVETCANQGADDDCDGTVDNVPNLGAACAVATNAGSCGSGTYQCEKGKAELACVTAAPLPETCNGIDDDCNGTIDDVPNLKKDAMNCGMCGRACPSGVACRNGECEQPMPMPGECNPACPAGQTCCGGACVDTRNDINHCGACGNPCGGAAPGCCSGQCVDLMSPSHCGRCGHDCSLLSTSTLTCMCTKTEGGAIECTGPLLNICL